MKRGFYSSVLSVMLMGTLSAAIAAESDQSAQAQKKQKVQIVVVDKKDKAANNNTHQKPRS